MNHLHIKNQARTTNVYNHNQFLKILDMAMKNPIKVNFVNSSILVNQKKLDLSKKKKILSIFQEIYTSPNKARDLDYLVPKIYPEITAKSISARQQECLVRNVTKLLSRSRKLAAQTFTNLPFEVEWFPYCRRLNAWKFLTIRENYSNTFLLTSI
jgi:hypothetical protein